jgi:hypothetical protein
MSGRRYITLDERDVVMHSPNTDEALRATAIRFLDLAKRRRAAAGPDPVDPETGEVRPRLWRFTFGLDEDVTVKQRGFFHACVLPQIAEQAEVDGQRFSVDTWKEHYRRKFLPDRFVMKRLPGWKKATPQRVRVSTEELGVKGYSEHIDRVIADAVTEFGVAFEFDESEREAARYRRPARKTQPKPTTEREETTA